MLVLVFVLIFSAYLLVEANTGSCRYTKLVQKSRLVSFSSPYIYTYHERCRIFFTCTRFGTRYQIQHKTEFYNEIEVFYKCCPGYELENSLSSNKCKPICNPKCINSDCAAPDICNCHLGYVKSSNKTVCAPVCTVPCIEGLCVKPNTCECNPGYIPYQNQTYICKPHCKHDCINGDCIAPNLCKCKLGYTQSQTSQNKCIPVCSPKCINGDCISPGVCRCWKGFLQINHSHVCTPHCSNECVNGKCIAFETCDCNPGYTTSDSNKYRCIPKCLPPCIHGVCELPNKCTCIVGYKMLLNTTTICEPICDVHCPDFGYCALPNHCACQSGYEFNETKHCVPICLPNCVNSECAAPDNCTCLPGFQATDDWNRCELLCEDHCMHGYCKHNECVCDEQWSGTDCNTTDFKAITKKFNHLVHQKTFLTSWHYISIVIWLLVFTTSTGFYFIYKRNICKFNQTSNKLHIAESRISKFNLYDENFMKQFGRHLGFYIRRKTLCFYIGTLISEIPKNKDTRIIFFSILLNALIIYLEAKRFLLEDK